MRVLVYGGREFGTSREEYKKAQSFLNDLAINVFPRTEEDEYGNYLPAITIISGEARGADSIGTDFAAINWTGYEGYPADWNTHGKAAGHIRNQQMLDSGIDLAVEFPGGRGTADMRRKLDKAGVKVLEYHE
jgi:hypothetical protein